MNEHDDVMCQVRESFSGLRMDLPVESVFARSRAQRRRRLAGLTATAAGTAGAAAAVALTLGGAGPAHSGNPSAASRGPVRLAAYSVTSGPGNSTTLVLRKGQQLNANALREELAQHGIPAIVTVGTFCRSTVAESTGSVIKSPSSQPAGSDVLVITGSDLPPGTMLSIGYGTSWVRFAVVADNAPLSCGLSSGQPVVHHLAPSGTKVHG
jgi:hypothetical protein